MKQVLLFHFFTDEETEEPRISYDICLESTVKKRQIKGLI